MLPCYCVLDLETTGANALTDRITEIAAVRFEHGREVARWSTLVNPGVPIAPFVQGLTGISDAMVAQAPPFESCAAQVLAMLEGAVLVAHNVRFDHGFLKNELLRAGIDLGVKTLCTVRLSRKLFPQERSHGLDALMQRHGLRTQQRHRAMGDVDVLLAWLRLVSGDLGAAAISSAATALLGGGASVPAHLQTPLRDVPRGAGVYLMYGEGPLPLYIGKSVRLRERVLSHFQGDHASTKEMRLSQEVRRIEWRETAGELGALLLESRLVKQLQPELNRRLRRQNVLCAWQVSEDAQDWPQVRLLQADQLGPAELTHLAGPYRSKSLALASLRTLADAHRLCPQALGLESGRGRCFAHQLGRCAGPCCGEEPREHHLNRVLAALAGQRLRPWPFATAMGWREHDAQSQRSEVHVFDQWCHVGSAHTEDELHGLLTTTQELRFDLDIYQMLLKRVALPGAPWIRLHS